MMFIATEFVTKSTPTVIFGDTHEIIKQKQSR